MALVGFQACFFQTRRDAHPSLAVVRRCMMRLVLWCDRERCILLTALEGDQQKHMYNKLEKGGYA